MKNTTEPLQSVPQSGIPCSHAERGNNNDDDI